MIPSPGRIVEYKLTAQDANDINRRREHARTSKVVEQATGAQVHAGNKVAEGESYPMVIVRVWGATEESSVNGQVLLDGNDTYWATSRAQGAEGGQWREYARVVSPPVAGAAAVQEEVPAPAEQVG